MEPSLGQNRLEDVSWLCSLSESELVSIFSIKTSLFGGVVGFCDGLNQIALKSRLLELKSQSFHSY
jgi:hypothetical protein